MQPLEEGGKLQLRRFSPLIAAALVSAAATLVVAGVPAVDFAYRRPELHVAVETSAFLIALLASFLILGRFLRSGLAADLLLVCALAALSWANLVAALAEAVEISSRLATWAPLGSRVLGSALFAAAAFAPAIRLRSPRSDAARALTGLGALLMAVVVAVWLAGTRIPVAVETDPGGELGRPDLHGHPVVLGVQLVTLALFAFAAVGYARRSARSGDELMNWLAVGAVFAAFARLNYFLYPSLYSDFVYTGDLFRLLFYGALLVGAAREIRSYWEGVARSAVLEERRRIARDLHDGTAQELAFVLRRLRGLRGLDSDRIAPLIAATERGLDDSRRAITVLSRPVDESLDTALADAVEHVAARAGIHIVLDLAEDVRVLPETREGLIRIACEAVNNAAKHSGADVVRVELLDGQRIQLVVEDEGVGFDPDSVAPGPLTGFGLVTMRERAEELGADLKIDTSPGHGTRVEVEVA